MKKYGFWALPLALILFFSGCSANEYKDDVSCKMLADAAVEDLPAELDFRELDESFRDFYFGELDGFDDCYIAYSADSEDISEFGVFHANSDESADKIEAACLEYLADLGQNSRAFIASYAPGELTKLDASEVRRYGRYVVYTVLDDEDAERIFEIMKNLLEK